MRRQLLPLRQHPLESELETDCQPRGDIKCWWILPNGHITRPAVKLSSIFNNI